MEEIVVLSGKGGTGKTSITAAFATLAEKLVVVDCDVDAADLHLVLAPAVKESHEFIGGKTAAINAGTCVACGKCAEICRFGAVLRMDDGVSYSIDKTSCEGCAVCEVFCPSKAITLEDSVDGHWYVSETRVGPMVHARLSAGGENSGKLVSFVRNEAKSIAQSTGADLILTDGPPGIGCPVIASLAGASRVVIVTEPTVSGIHDLQRVAKLTSHFRVPASIIINKSDINPGKTEEIESFASAHSIDLLGRVPYDQIVIKAQLAGRSITEYSDGIVSSALREIWGRLSHNISTID